METRLRARAVEAKVDALQEALDELLQRSSAARRGGGEGGGAGGLPGRQQVTALQTAVCGKLLQGGSR